jgi:pimeloyl-ACP methyl ester carboxylesterase
MRARQPDREGFVERGGVRVFYEVFGRGEPTVLLLPTWSIVHSRQWKMQVPYLARHFRVVSVDGRGNGRSDRPSRAEDYAACEFADDALAVMDATGTSPAVLVSFSAGAQRALLLAANRPELVAGAVFIAPSLPIAEPHPERAVHSFGEPLATDDGWAKYNAHYWRRDYRGFLEYFFSRVFTEPHSTKQIEDMVGWGLETDAETLIATQNAPDPDAEQVLELCSRVRCPVLVIHGDEDAISPHARGLALAEATRGRLVTLSGSGHAPHARDPVKVNLLIRAFVDALPRHASRELEQPIDRAERAGA